jgi:hypothetical protein
MASITDYINVNDPNFLKEYAGKLIKDETGYYQVGNNGLTLFAPDNINFLGFDDPTYGGAKRQLADFD